jgi:predicted nucleic acid-binding protein
MSRYLLDTSALLTLRDNEKGADQVADLLYKAELAENQCFSCFMSLMELFYRVWKDEDEQTGRLAYEQCQSLPIIWIHENKALLEKSAEIKATMQLSLADAWIAASAIKQKAALVHTDPEFAKLVCPQLVLPYK